MKDHGPGGKNRRKAKGSAMSGSRRDILFAGPDQSYAFVTENLGNCHFRLQCEDGAERLGVLRGAMRKRAWVRRTDILLVTKRSFQDDKVDIVHRYSSEDVHYLNSVQHIPAALMAWYSTGESAAVPDEDADLLVFEGDVDAV